MERKFSKVHAIVLFSFVAIIKSMQFRRFVTDLIVKLAPHLEEYKYNLFFKLIIVVVI